MKPLTSHFSKAIIALFPALIFLALLVPSLPVSASGNPFDTNIKLNPDCKFKRLSNGSVIIISKNSQGVEVKQQFDDFYADLLTAAYKKQRTEYILESFAQKYALSEDECRREIKHALNVLSEWNIVIRDDRMASR